MYGCISCASPVRYDGQNCFRGKEIASGDIYIYITPIQKFNPVNALQIDYFVAIITQYNSMENLW